MCCELGWSLTGHPNPPHTNYIQTHSVRPPAREKIYCIVSVSMSYEKIINCSRKMKNLRFVFFFFRLSQLRVTKLVLSVDCWTQPVWNTKLWHRYEKWMVKTSKIQSLLLSPLFFARFMMTMIMMINNDCFMGALAREQTTTNRAILIVFAVIRFWCRARERMCIWKLQMSFSLSIIAFYTNAFDSPIFLALGLGQRVVANVTK